MDVMLFRVFVTESSSYLFAGFLLFVHNVFGLAGEVGLYVFYGNGHQALSCCKACPCDVWGDEAVAGGEEW